MKFRTKKGRILEVKNLTTINALRKLKLEEVKEETTNEVDSKETTKEEVVETTKEEVKPLPKKTVKRGRSKK